ncbi:hypothetical protein D9619_006495 [Psilocybe cf. subviscida]|uniref:Cytochrome P450 n=1 Tax=Psilocybe cf. subviscida TaxID=2480587 RepID=A0A8H5B4E3_9AGAR|nr:hypothetical protein D9619_006495 [Psilocybe cf. subviscida]
MLMVLIWSKVLMAKNPIPRLLQKSLQKALAKCPELSCNVLEATMFFFVAKCLIIYALSWILWKALHRRLFPSPLDNIPGPKPSSFLLGSVAELQNPNAWAFHKAIAEKFGGVIKLKGLLGQDTLYVFDPKALHNILVKDQDIYEEHPIAITFSRLAFGDGLLGTLGDQHRKQRKMLNPVFSTAHMRNMVPVFYDISHKLRYAIAKKVADGPREVDVVPWMTRTTLELIGQTGLGFSFDSLAEDEATHPYAKALTGLFPTAFKLRFAFPFVPSLYQLGSTKFRRLVIGAIPWKALHETRDLIDLMTRTSREIYEEKKKALADGDEVLTTKVGQGKDIMSILMRANMSASKAESLTEEEILGQMSTLIFAAMDTTSNALSRILHLLSTHPEVQDRLRQEIHEARNNYGDEDLPYDKLVLLPYLDAICRETLRLHPPVTGAQRQAIQDVVLPLSSPIKGLDGKEVHEIHVPKGTQVTVAILAANRNVEIWGPDAEEWKPERWLEPLPESVTNARLPGIYSHLLTFIGGGRACIGFKFSQLEMKVVLFMLVENFCFSLSEHEIIWEMNGVTSPKARGSDNKLPNMPLLVERI